MPGVRPVERRVPPYRGGGASLDLAGAPEGATRHREPGAWNDLLSLWVRGTQMAEIDADRVTDELEQVEREIVEGNAFLHDSPGSYVAGVHAVVVEMEDRIHDAEETSTSDG